MKNYEVRYERDETGWWVASVPEIPGCHTQGRTIEQARRRIRKALGLFVSDAEKAIFLDDIRLPAGVRRIINRHQLSRQRFEEHRAQCQLSTLEAVRVLTRELRLSLRDAGELLGLSHQRIQQLVDKQPVN